MRYAISNCHCRAITEPTQSLVFTGPCVVTGKVHSVTVSADGFDKYNQGALIQEAFPDVSRSDREFLISGTSPEGWDQLFGGFEDEEECDAASATVAQ